jgi:hypothetical protein
VTIFLKLLYFNLKRELAVLYHHRAGSSVSHVNNCSPVESSSDLVSAGDNLNQPCFFKYSKLLTTVGRYTVVLIRPLYSFYILFSTNKKTP